MAEDPAPQAESSGSLKLTLIICGVVTILTAGTYWLIVNTQPKAVRETQTKQTAMWVEVTTAEVGTFRPQIMALGTVIPAREIQLSPRVSGQILERSEAFNPGRFLKRGDPLLQIDPADYRNAVEQRRSERDQAQANLDLEMGQQKIARSDYKLLEQLGNLPATETPHLVLRQPQLQTAKARLDSAQAAVKQAELDLERTSIKAPFNLQVIERKVDVGSQVAPGDELAHLVGIETYWVSTTVPLRALPWIEFANRDAATGSTATVRNRSAWPAGQSREGRVGQLIGNLNEQTRLARILITVEDPLALQSAEQNQPSLLLGSMLQCTITGREIADVVRLERNLLRDNDRVWVMDDEDKLRIINPEITFQDVEYAYISGGIVQGDRIVTSNLSSVNEGALLRLESSEP